MLEDVLEATTANVYDAEAWDVTTQLPVIKRHRSFDEDCEPSALKMGDVPNKKQYIDKKLPRYRVVYEPRTESLRLEAPPVREKEAPRDLEHEFRRLAEQWRSETMFISLDRERACSFAYQQIIGMGKDALPFIFRELKETTSDWFWALRAISRTDVEVKPEDKGNVHKIAEAWIEWGRQNRYVA